MYKTDKANRRFMVDHYMISFPAVSVRNFGLSLLYIACLLLPFSTSRDTGLVFSPGIPIFYFASLVLLFSRRQSSISRGNIYFLVSLFLMMMLPAVFSIITPNAAAALWRATAYIFGFAIILYSVFAKDDKYLNLRIYNSIKILTLSTSLYYIINFMLKAFRYGISEVALDRGSGGLAELPWGASNLVAAVIFLGIISILDQFLNVKTRSRHDPAILFIAMLAIVLTFSRTVILGLLFIILFILIYKKSVGILSSLLIIVGLMFTVYSNLEGPEKQSMDILLSDRFNTNSASDFNGREQIWREYIDYYSIDHSPIGYFAGLDKFSHSGHSLYISTLIEQGVIGIAAIVATFLIFIIILINRRKYFLAFSFLCLIILFNFEDLFYNHQYILLFSLYISYGLTSRYRRPEDG